MELVSGKAITGNIRIKVADDNMMGRFKEEPVVDSNSIGSVSEISALVNVKKSRLGEVLGNSSQGSLCQNLGKMKMKGTVGRPRKSNRFIQILLILSWVRNIQQKGMEQ